MLRIIILFVVAPLLLLGCASHESKNVMLQHVIDSVKNNEKGMIIFKTTMNIKTNSHDNAEVLGVVAYMAKIKFNGEKFVSGNKKIIFDTRNHDVYELPMCGYSAMVLNPGLYALFKIKYKYRPYGTPYYLNDSATAMMQAPFIAVFVATAGEVNYIGELDINKSTKDYKSIFKFSAKDDFDKCFVSGDIKLPYLQDRLQKGILKIVRPEISVDVLDG